MKNYLYVMVCLMMVGIQSVMAQLNITAPTPPIVASDLQDDTDYLFYNWEADRYVYSSYSKQNNIGSARAYRLKKQDDNTYYICYKSSNSTYSWYTDGNSSETGSQQMSNNYLTSVSETNGSFTFKDTLINDATTGANIPTMVLQRAPKCSNYFVSKSIQFTSSSDYLYEAPGISNWLIAPADSAGRRYLSQARLYRMLCNLSKYTQNNTGALDYYIAIYNNPQTTTNDFEEAVITLQNADDFNSWCNSKWTDTEYPLFFVDNSNASYRWERNDNGYLSRYMYSGSNYPTSMNFTATVTVDQEATLRYCIYDDYDNSPSSTQDVYLDGVLVRSLPLQEFQREDKYYHETLSPGTHTLRFVFNNNSQTSFIPTIKNISVYKLPAEISVSLVEQGSLGTEVLKHVNNVSDVRRLKVSGKFGSDDFAKIEMMPKLAQLDLSETDIKEIPDDQFNRWAKSNVQWLHKLVLPNNLEKIGVRAFYQSYVEDLTFPESLKSIDNYAFYESRITGAMLPDSMESVGVRAFSYCYLLKQANWPAKIKSVSSLCFHGSQYMESCTLHEGLTAIQHEAFRSCGNLYINKIPSTVSTVEYEGFASCKIDTLVMKQPMSLGRSSFYNCGIKHLIIASGTTIGDRAFYGATVSELNIPDNTSMGTYAFAYGQLSKLEIGEGCTINPYAFSNNKLTEVQMPTTYYAASNYSYNERIWGYRSVSSSDRGRYNNGEWYNGYDFEDKYDYTDQTISGNYIFNSNPTLERMIIKSPTVMTGDGRSTLFANCNDTFKFVVPQYLVSSYKLADFWNAYSARIEGFSTADIDYWEIRQPLTLNYDSRFEGSPTLNLQSGGYLTIKGEAPMNINDFEVWHNQNWPSSGGSAQIISECENIVVNGNVKYGTYTDGNKWYFACMPFNFRPSDITNDKGADYVLYYYDGANRAVNGATGSWKRIPNDTIVTAGTGFIMQTSKNENSYFYAVNDADKDRMLGNSIFVKTLQQHYAEESANKGWNLVGNPYLCYYNLHKLSFTAPITTWTGSTYKAYSIIDDDYAIKPNEAFFVQCPDEVTTMAFPIAGRQMTSEITDQNGAPAFEIKKSDRPLLDIVLSSQENRSDETRVVINEKASMQYETSRDASKFTTMDAQTPQIFTLGTDGTHYAINERPTGDGSVQLGFTAPESGTYTISVKRNRDFGQVSVLDRKTGLTYDITKTEYSFHAEAGTDYSRLVLLGAEITGIKTIDVNKDTSNGVETYDLGGRRVNGSHKSGLYLMRSANGKTRKVTVK